MSLTKILKDAANKENDFDVADMLENKDLLIPFLKANYYDCKIKGMHTLKSAVFALNQVKMLIACIDKYSKEQGFDKEQYKQRRNLDRCLFDLEFYVPMQRETGNIFDHYYKRGDRPSLINTSDPRVENFHIFTMARGKTVDIVKELEPVYKAAIRQIIPVLKSEGYKEQD